MSNLTAISYQHDIPATKVHDQTGSDDKSIKTNLNRITSFIQDSNRLQDDGEQSMPQFIQDMYRNPNMAYDFKKLHRTTDKKSMSRIICIPHIGKKKITLYDQMISLYK